MRRLRQARQAPAGAVARLGCALALSAAIHAALLVAPVAPSPPPLPAHAGAIVVRLAMVAAPQAAPARPKPPASPGRAESPPHVPARVEPVALAPALETATPGIPRLQDLVHYEAKDLDTFPELRESLRPVYPAAALEQGIAGHVVLLVSIDETGKVPEAAVVDAVPEGQFADPARDALEKASFLPATRDGRQVRSRVLIDVSFDPANP